jgi:hypothetical protein
MTHPENGLLGISVVVGVGANSPTPTTTANPEEPRGFWYNDGDVPG